MHRSPHKHTRTRRAPFTPPGIYATATGAVAPCSMARREVEVEVAWKGRKFQLCCYPACLPACVAGNTLGDGSVPEGREAG